jgi:flagellar hook-length control protein FliK
MELMAVLGAAAQPGIEAEVPDARDPATAAAFTVLLAGLVAPPPIATPAADPAPAGAPAAGRPVAAAAAVTAIATEAIDLELPAPAGHADPAAAGPTAPGRPASTGIEGAPAPAQPGVDRDQPPPEPGPRLEVVPATRTESVGAGVDAALPTGPLGAVVDAAPPAGPGAPDAAPAAADILLGRPVPSPERPPAQGPASPATGPVTRTATVRPATAAGDTAGPADGGNEPTSAPRRAEPAEVTGAAAPAPAEPARAHATGTSPHVTDAAPGPGARTLERVLAAQLVERVGTLRHRDDGDYELTLQLDPPDLGRVELRVRLEGGVVHVQVGAQAAGTGDLLRRALPELREALVDAGLTAGTLDIGPHTGQDGHAGAGGTRPDEATTGADPSARARTGTTSAPDPLPIRTGAARGVDVLL